MPHKKDLTTVKQGKATTVQDRSGKRLTEEWQILNRYTEYCSELYNYKASGDPSVLNCSQTDTEDDHPNPSQRSGGCSTITEEREVSWSRQHPSRTGPSRWRGCNHRSGEQGKIEKTGCKIICGAPTTLAVKGLMMMMMMSGKCY